MDIILMRSNVFIIIISAVSCSFPLPAITPEFCKTDEYFDPFCLVCKRCGWSSNTTQEGQQAFQTLDGSACQCKPRHSLEKRNDAYNIICKPCKDEQVTSLDGRRCLPCLDNDFNITLGVCGPCGNGFIVEEENVQMCKPCKNGTVFNKGSGRCVTCPLGFVVGVDKCVCPNNTIFSGGRCFTEIKSTNSPYTVTFESGVEVPRSAFFVEHIHAAHSNCLDQNRTACQMLANMCAMLQYDVPDLYLEKNACSMFMEYIATKSSECKLGENDANKLWLFYLKQDATSVLSKTNVPFTYSSDPKSMASRLKILAMKYNINGTLREVSYLQSTELQLCKRNFDGDDLAFIFGTRVEKKCEIHLQKLWDESELYFYDLFLTADVQNKTEMYPIHVLIKSIRKNGEYVNKNSDTSRWYLVRRFFLTDPVSGIEDGLAIQDRHHQPLAKVFRYAADVSLKIKLNRYGPAGSIYPPLLTIYHAEATPDDYMKNKRVSATFAVSYEMDQSNSEDAIAITLGVLSALAFIWSILQTWSWHKRSGKHVIDVLVLGKFSIFMCGNLATVFFIVTFCACLNWFVVFKNQDVVHLLLPVPVQERFLSVYLSIAFVMKALHVIHILVVQCTADMFFIDWEKPRIKSSSGNRPSSKPIPDNASSGGSGKVASASSNKFGSERATGDVPTVSIWRTYFIANEWAEIQSLRKISLSIQLFGTLFFLKVVGFENSALASPPLDIPLSEAVVNVPYSTCCRFVLGAGIFLCIAAIQVIARKVIYERFVEDKLQQYVDLCSVSNISVFIMITKRYGYYIHGRSAHGRADVNMKEMHELLRREEEDLCGHRGLLPNTEQQTFQMALPIGMHDQFRRLLVPLTAYSQAADRMQGVGGNLSKVDIDRVVNTYQMLNKFLSGFIEHAFKDLDYIVKDKVMLESLIDIECHEVADRGYFYNDDGHSFDSVLLFGNETTLLIFDVLLFSVIDIASADYTLAAVLTFFIGKGIQAVRKSVGRRNIVRKALVDERFLT